MWTMKAIHGIVVEWLSYQLTTERAAALILKTIACSSMGMYSIMKAMDELPQELVDAMR